MAAPFVRDRSVERIASKKEILFFPFIIGALVRLKTSLRQTHDVPSAKALKRRLEIALRELMEH